MKKKICFILICVILLFVSINNAEASKSGWGINDRFIWLITEKEESSNTSFGIYGHHYFTEIEIIKDMKIKVLELNPDSDEYTYSYDINENTIYNSDSTAETQTQNYEGLSNNNYNGSQFFSYFGDINDFIFIDIRWFHASYGYYLTSLSFNTDILVNNLSYILKTDWQIFNQNFKNLFDPSSVVDEFESEPVTLDDFLGNTSSTIMGKSNLTEALQEFKTDTRKWTFEFDLSDRLFRPGASDFQICGIAFVKLELEYSKDCVLEKLVYESSWEYNDLPNIRVRGSKEIEITRKPIFDPSFITALVAASLIVIIGVAIFRVRSKSKTVVVKRKTKSVESDLIQTPTEITQENCSICKLEIRENQRLKQCMLCHAIFHEEHLVDWLESNDDCPVCDRKIKKSRNKIH